MKKFLVKLILVIIAPVFFYTSVSASIRTTQDSKEIPPIDFTLSPMKANEPKDEPYPFHKFVTLGLIRGFQRFISPSNGESCLMHPSCSNYGYQAFQINNPFLATLMTADRLHRCTHDVENYEVVEVNEKVKFLDEPNGPFYSPNYHFSDNPSLVTEFNNASFSVPENLDIQSPDALLYHFAIELELEANFNQAEIEYRRLLTYYPSSPLAHLAARAVLVCRYRSGKYLAAIRWAQSLLGKPYNETNVQEINYISGICYFKLQNYPAARYLFQTVINENNKEFMDKALLLAGLSYVYELKWEEATQSFAQVPQNSSFKVNATFCEKLSSEGKRMKLKNPVLAGTLSTIPGLGYLYAGYPKTALSSLIVNGLFIGSTRSSIQKDNDSTAATTGIIGLAWYAGNIYGSVQSAHRKNEKSRLDLFAKFDLGFQY